MLILQAGGSIFDQNDKPNFASERNAYVLAQLTTWIVGPNATCTDVPNATAAGHRQRLEGFVIGTLVPDWMAGSWKIENPGLSGKLKFIPVPAWEKGGRRTTVAGGTMIGITKASNNFETNWEFIKHLYLSPKLARHMFENTSIISPVKATWKESFYDEPDPFFSGQPIGRMYIEQAADVPHRPSSPYTSAANQKIAGSLIALAQYARSNEIYDAKLLEVEVLRILQDAQASLERLISRNLFLSDNEK